jgi:hypothetical protein
MLGNSVSLRIPVGKLHNDRYVPLLPPLVELIANYQKLRGPIRSGRLLERDDDRPFVRRTIHRYVERVAKRGGVGHVHPHQLRHTMATQFMIASNNCSGAAGPRRRAGGGRAYPCTLRADEVPLQRSSELVSGETQRPDSSDDIHRFRSHLHAGNSFLLNATNGESLGQRESGSPAHSLRG